MVNLKIKKIPHKIKKLLVARKKLVIVMFCLILFYDIFIYQEISNSLSIFLLVIWILFIYILKIKPNQSFILGLFSYILTFIFQFFGKMMIVEKGVTWFASLFILSLIQKFLEKDTDGKWY